MNEGGDEREGRGNPHEGKHLGSDIDADVEVGLGRQGVFEDDRYGGRNDRGRRDHQSGNRGQEDNRQTPPPRKEDDGCQKHEQEVQDKAGNEEAEHDVRSDPQEAEDVVHLGRQSYGCAGQEFVSEDGDRVKPK